MTSVSTWCDRVAAQLDARLPGAVRRNASIAELTTYRIGGTAAVLVRADDEASLQIVAEVLADDGPPVLVIGRGSNLLVADGGFDGVAIVLAGTHEAMEATPGADAIIAGAAVPLPVVARRAAGAGLGGLEFFVGIPGSVGGAVRMNAGGHGRETRDVLRRAWVLDLTAGGAAPATPKDAAELDLSYRHSNVVATAVVTRAELLVTPDDPVRCEERLGEIVRWRREHQPGGSNAGSVFRNPPSDSAGRLIDQAGLKGFRVGGAVVSTKHANFFQAEAGATAADIRSLVLAVQTRVEAATGVTLVPELQMIGFEDVGGSS